jgi:hypothetical protein
MISVNLCLRGRGAMAARPCVVLPFRPNVATRATVSARQVSPTQQNQKPLGEALGAVAHPDAPSPRGPQFQIDSRIDFPGAAAGLGQGSLVR